MRPIFHRKGKHSFQLSILLWGIITLLFLLTFPGLYRSEVLAQEGTIHLVLEDVYGDYAIWVQDPAIEKWSVIPLPEALGTAQMKEATLTVIDGWPTVVNRDNEALLLYDHGRLQPVTNGQAHLQNGQWLSWSGTSWETAGPPAGNDDPASLALQSYLNETLPALQLHYVVVLHSHDDPEENLVRAGNNYQFAHAILPGWGGPMVAPLLVSLDQDGGITAVTLLAGNTEPVTSGPFNRRDLQEIYQGFTYDSEQQGVVDLGPVLARSQNGDTYVLQSNYLARMLAPGDWFRSSLFRLLRREDLADAAAIRAGRNLAPETIYAATAAGAYSQLDASALAETETEQCPEEVPTWIESQTDLISLIFTQPDSELGRRFSLLLAQTLDEDYDRFARLFAEQLPLPLNIRLYPDRTTYRCLNPLAPDLPASRFHSRIGNREIVLISNEIDSRIADWEVLVRSGIRFEMASLFVETLTANQAPPGLQSGIGLYVQNPRELLERSQLTPAETPRASWRFFWEEPAVAANNAVALPAMTTVAYLVDAYGWPTFLDFLHNLATANSYRQALLDTYQTDTTALESQWQLYDAAYYTDRWRANVFYGFDLAEFEQLLAAGAYNDAAAGLKEAITFLETSGDAARLAQAQALMQAARKGQEAASLLAQSRQALQTRQYEAAIVLADEAEATYLDLDDQRRQDEITSYRDWAKEVLTLRLELVQLQDSNNADMDRLVAIGQRLGELGDTESADTVAEIIAAYNLDRQETADNLVWRIALLPVAMIALRVLLVLRRRPVESQLL